MMTVFGTRFSINAMGWRKTILNAPVLNMCYEDIYMLDIDGLFGNHELDVELIVKGDLYLINIIDDRIPKEYLFPQQNNLFKRITND